MTKRFWSAFFCLILGLSLAPVQPAAAETIKEYQERIKREQEEARKKQKQQEDKSKDGQDSGSCFDFLGCFFNVLSAPRDHDDRDNQPDDAPRDPPPSDNQGGGSCFDGLTGGYAGSVGNLRFPGAPEDQFWLAEVAVAGSYLFGEDVSYFEILAHANINLAFFHVNVFFQHLEDFYGSSLNTLSPNAGVSLVLPGAILSIYGGAFWQPGLFVFFSFGTSGKVFLPYGLILGWYTLFSIYDTLSFIIISPSFDLSIDRFTIGVGFNYYNYSNVLTLYGPALRVAIWL